MGRNMVRTGTRWHALIGQFAFTRLGMRNSAGGFSAESECGWIAAARQAALPETGPGRSQPKSQS